MEEEEINGDSLLDDNTSESSLVTSDISESYEWGQHAEYIFIEPTTKEQRREAYLLAQASKTSNTQDNPISINQEINPLVTSQFPIAYQSPALTEAQPSNNQTPNPFGEQPLPITNTPRKRGCPKGTTKATNTKPASQNPVGHPKKNNNNIQPEQPTLAQTESNLASTNNMETQDDHEKILASRQYINQPVVYEPPIPEAYHNLEVHSYMRVSSQY